MSVMERAVTESFSRGTASGSGALGFLAVLVAGAGAGVTPYGYDTGVYQTKETQPVDQSFPVIYGHDIVQALQSQWISANSFIRLTGNVFPTRSTILSLYNDTAESLLAKQLVRVASDLTARQTEMDGSAKRVLYGRMRELIRR